MSFRNYPDSEQAQDADRPDREAELRSHALQEVGTWEEGQGRSRLVQELYERVAAKMSSLRDLLAQRSSQGGSLPQSLDSLVKNIPLVSTAVLETKGLTKTGRDLPVIAAQGEMLVPRAFALSRAYLVAVRFCFHGPTLLAYVRAVQESVNLRMGELWALRPMMQLMLLDRIGEAAQRILEEPDAAKELPGGIRAQAVLTACVDSLREISLAEWKDLFEAMSRTNEILRGDPSGVYAAMDFETRERYRQVIAELAKNSPLDEEEIARRSVKLAQEAEIESHDGHHLAERRRHVGYYLVSKGTKTLKRRIGHRPPVLSRLRDLVLAYPSFFYFSGLLVTTLSIMHFVFRGVGEAYVGPLAVFLLLLPALESAIGVLNRLVASFLQPKTLPKLDYSEGIPAECATMIVVPSLLLSEEHVRELVAHLEIRYLANTDPNLYFALLTDSPDSSQQFDEKDELIGLCSWLVEQLNVRHAKAGRRPFLLFHRHRVYADSEGTWMGWERKRGKLLDLNNLLRGNFDSFPVKVGDTSILPAIRFVITLDSDTKLPKDSARKLVGTMAHPLNRAVVDTRTNTVVEGYGILQPRIGVSVDAARRSRLADLLSGQTGFDIYTRAVSDVYQDLFMEGSFTGKGIYEVDAYQQVLSQRFPASSLLSHDLIEGSYARAGLVSDVELIDDYPSHFTAYSKRKHRWVRGDWQILFWLLPRVPDNLRRWVRNPLNLLSRWKIFDNLRRSLTEIAVFSLLLASWLFLPGSALRWSVAVIVLLLLPAYLQLLMSLFSILRSENRKGRSEQILDAFIESQVHPFLILAFLPHQVLLMTDAILTTAVRLFLTRKKLLEWETAVQAEHGLGKPSAVEKYLDWTPWVSVVVAVAVILVRPESYLVALPFLVVWTVSGPFCSWLNRAQLVDSQSWSVSDEMFLRKAGLRTWRFFREFSRAENNWLIPDSVQEQPHIVTEKISPTNLAFLLNARLAAYELGYINVDEFAEQTGNTLAASSRLVRYHGHFLNWYDTVTLQPMSPLFVSTVDSGNLAAGLCALKQGALAMTGQPVVRPAMWHGIRDHLSLVVELSSLMAHSPKTAGAISELVAEVGRADTGEVDRIAMLLAAEDRIRELRSVQPRTSSPEFEWWQSETLERFRNLRQHVTSLAPWLLPEFRALLSMEESPLANGSIAVPLRELPKYAAGLEREVRSAADRATDPDVLAAMNALCPLLASCAANARAVVEKLEEIAELADRLLQDMDFRFLYNSRRKLLSVGSDIETGELLPSCYDLLASEARIAVFLAIAKGDIPLEAWFHLGRGHILFDNERVLQSWTGTMFEYLMPLLWMQSSRGAILHRSARAAVNSQRKYAAARYVPWGISESAWSLRDDSGRYQYHAFGVPALAAKDLGSQSLVIAPYATFLALGVDTPAALANLKRMRNLFWLGSYGFYESAEYTPSRRGEPPTHEIIKSWMAHHQGMSLLAICNTVARGVIQHYFHEEPMVKANELILSEKVPVDSPVRMPDRIPADQFELLNPA